MLPGEIFKKCGIYMMIEKRMEKSIKKNTLRNAGYLTKCIAYQLFNVLDEDLREYNLIIK